MQKSVLTLAKLYIKMERIKLKKGFKESIIKTLKDIFYAPMNIYKSIYKSEPFNAEGNSYNNDKVLGIVLFVTEIIRAFDFNPTSQIIGKVLDSYDNVETCVNNSQQILDKFNDAFLMEKESDTEEKTLMKKQQISIINLITSNPDSISSSADSSKAKKANLTDTQLQQKCQAVENMIKNHKNS